MGAEQSDHCRAYFRSPWLSVAAHVAESVQTLAEWLHPQPNALALAADASKGQFSRALTELAWRRLFWARVFAKRNEFGAPAAELGAAWSKLLDATEAWNSELMVNLQLLDHFYPGTGKRELLEGDLQDRWGSLDDLLRQLKYMADPSSSPAAADLRKKISSEADELNVALYRFVSGLDPPVLSSRQ